MVSPTKLVRVRPSTNGAARFRRASRRRARAGERISTSEAAKLKQKSLAGAAGQGRLILQRFLSGQINITAVKNNAGPNGKDVVDTQFRPAFLPQSPESFTYDDDGNLTDDGQWHYTWDCENRLQAAETTVSAVAAGVHKQKSVFQYDHRSRRIQTQSYIWDEAGSPHIVEHFLSIFRDWSLLAESDGASDSKSVVRSYVWGADISARGNSAGGIGGLLWTTVANPGVLGLAIFDGAGNVMKLIDTTTGSSLAKYEYGPFGELARAEGALSDANPFRFSTKYTDKRTSLDYFGYRYFQPQTGSWLSKDPIGERGGRNLYAMCYNNPLSFVDYLGQDPKPVDGGFGFAGWTDHGSGVTEDGNFKDRAGGRDNPNVGGGATGKDLLEHLKFLSKPNCCIRNYRIAGHGWAKGQGNGIPSYHSGDEEGFRLDKTGIPSTDGDVRDLNDLRAAIGAGSIKFCKTCTISVFACRVSAAFVEGLAATTGCKVTAAGGACQRNPNGGGWRSNADIEGDSDQFRQSNGGTPAVDLGHTYQPPLFPK